MAINIDSTNLDLQEYNDLITQIYADKEVTSLWRVLWNRIKLPFTLLIASLVMVVMRSFDFVLFVRMVTKMRNYEFFLSSIMLPPFFLIIFWPIVWFKMFVTKSINSEMRKYPWYKFMWMGILANISNLIMTIPSAYVPGPIQVVVAQSVIVVNMLMAFFYTGARYNALHYGGVLSVIIGIIIGVFPFFENGLSMITNDNIWIWITSIPLAASNLYTERALKGHDLDIMYVQAWTMVYQWIFGWLTFALVLIPLPYPYHYVKINDVPEYFWNGFKCFCGYNSINPDQSKHYDMCEGFYLLTAVFMSLNLTYSYAMLYVFKYGSSTLAVIASAARIALSNFAFLIPIVAGEATTNRLSMFDVEALVICIFGTILYSVTKENKANPATDRIELAMMHLREQLSNKTYRLASFFDIRL